MTNKTTNEFSFVLKPSKYGVGVFVTHDIMKGTQLRLFGKDGKQGDCVRKKNKVPRRFFDYCIEQNDYLVCPKDFGCMPVGWYINHSTNFNATHHKDYGFYASKDIKEGDEILIDYNTLGEPDKFKDDYYKNK